MNDKRNMESKDLAMAQERLAESIIFSRNLQAQLDQVKIDLTNQVNTKQGIQKLLEQLEMQVKVLNQELDVSEGQKIKLQSIIQILKQ